MAWQAAIGWMIATVCCGVTVDARAASDREMAAVLQRLEMLETQNREFSRQIAALERQNASLQTALTTGPESASGTVAGATGGAATSATIPPPTTAVPAAPVPAADSTGKAATSAAQTALEWASRVRIAGDLRYRHENIDDGSQPEDRSRETVRARIAAAIQFMDSIDGEIGISTGASDPRGGSATLGAAGSRKPLGLDVAYARWRATDELAVIAGKMRQPFVRPGMSLFVDNEIRPEGVAATYGGKSGIFGSAFNYWLEERPTDVDSTMLGGQLGWAANTDALKLKIGAGYYDLHNIKGEDPDFGDGVVSAFGNSVTDAGLYAYDYDIGQLFADATFFIGELPVNAFADYAHNFRADNGLDDAFGVGVLVGKASAPGRWEFGVMHQAVDKDALYGHWFDSDFAGGVTDSTGQFYRLAYMPVQRVLLNVGYYDTAFNVDVGDETDYDRWQLDFNFLF
jgi:hypothetical protein